MISDAARRRYQAIVPPHVDEAFALARWLSGSAADAEDIVQEAALRALNALETAIVERPRAWFLRIVRNAALTWMAKNRSQPLAFAGGGDDLAAIEPFDPNCDQRSPEALLIAAEDGERVRRAIAALAPALREALVLREINGLAYREIAQAINIPASLLVSLFLVILSEFLLGPLVAVSTDSVIRINLPIGLAGVLIGAYSLIARREAIPQLIGILAMENGAFFAGIAIANELPLIAELGVAVGVMLIAVVIGLLTRNIRQAVGTTEASTLSELKEEASSWR